MKKTILVSLIIIVAYSSSHAQLKVSTSGNVNLGGTNNAWTKLQVVGNSTFTNTSGTITSSAYIRGLSTYSTATTPDYTWFNNDITGIFHPSLDVIAFTINGAEKMRIDNGYSGRVIIGGGGAAWSNSLTVNGSAYSTGGWNVPSDMRYKKNIKPIEQALDKILKLNGKSYEYNTDEFKSMNFKKGTAFGFIAQEVAEIIPEAVQKDSNDYYSMNYDMVIPVLVEAIKQQNATITDLQKQINSCCTGSIKSDQKTIGQSNTVENSTDAILYQNTPNPFSKETQIKCFIPENALVSGIYIYNMQGTQLKKISINGKGVQNNTIQSSELNAGMYMYTLIIDGKEIDTKKMILTE